MFYQILIKKAYLFLSLAGLILPLSSQANAFLNARTIISLPVSTQTAYSLGIGQNPAPDQGAAIRNLEKALLGDIYISQIKPEKMHEAYQVFVMNLKEKSKNWSPADWENAEQIMNKLHFRRKTVQEEISADDKIKITALQVQYRALKTQKDL